MKVPVRKRRRCARPHFDPYQAIRKEGILVLCPRCGREAAVKLEGGSYATLRCSHCGHVGKRSLWEEQITAQGLCEDCGRQMEVEVRSKKHPKYPAIWTSCPYCGKAQYACAQASGKVYADPLSKMGLDLYLRIPYRGRVIWAFNRGHLDYLISYAAFCVSRGEPDVSRESRRCLPDYLAKEKNMSRILRVLIRLRDGRRRF